MTEPSAPSQLVVNASVQLAQILQGPMQAEKLNRALRHLAKWRAMMLLQTIVSRDGPRVQSGPFAGMMYRMASEGAGAARLLGCYESSLAPVIDQIARGPYAQIIDIGCAEGYYAVGLARLMPQCRILARDANPDALALCAQLAADNGVADRVITGGAMQHADFDICAAAPTCIICDIEGAEAALLDPALAPALLQADILVETHHPDTIALLTDRFAATHRVERLDRRLAPQGLPDWMDSFSDLDRLLALWEWRTAPTPWLWMTERTTHAQQ